MSKAVHHTLERKYPGGMTDHVHLEVIDHGVTGFLADVGDVETMARYAIDILSDEKKLREMGKAARRSAQSRFCASKIIPQYEEFYRTVLERAS